VLKQKLSIFSRLTCSEFLFCGFFFLKIDNIFCLVWKSCWAILSFYFNFINTNFINTNFINTNFINTNFINTNFINTNLDYNNIFLTAKFNNTFNDLDIDLSLVTMMNSYQVECIGCE